MKVTRPSRAGFLRNKKEKRLPLHRRCFLFRDILVLGNLLRSWTGLHIRLLRWDFRLLFLGFGCHDDAFADKCQRSVIVPHGTAPPAAYHAELTARLRSASAISGSPISSGSYWPPYQPSASSRVRRRLLEMFFKNS